MYYFLLCTPISSQEFHILAKNCYGQFFFLILDFLKGIQQHLTTFLNLHYVKTVGLSIFHVLICQNWSVFSNILHLMLFVCFLITELWELFVYSNVYSNVLSNRWLANVLPQSVAYIFILFLVSFTEQKILISVESIYQLNLLWIMLLVLHLGNLCLTLSQKDFLLCSSRTFLISGFKLGL